MTKTDPVSSKSPLASISANAAPRAISPDPEEGPARIPSNPTPVYPSLRQLCDARPSLHAIWASVTAPRIARLRNALSLHTASLRVDYATAFLEARAALAPGGDSDRADPAIAAAASARALTAEFLAALLATPTPRHKYAPKRIDTIRESLVAVIGPGPEDDFSPHTPEITRHIPGPLPAFEHTTHMCMAALCDGWEVDECIRMWAQVHTGTFSRSGRTFRPGPDRSYADDYDWSSLQVRTISRALGEAPVSIYISHGQIVAITAGNRLRLRARPSKGTPARSLNDLPAFIALPRDQQGRPIIPKSRVTALVEAQDAWHQELGPLDSVTSTIVRGLLVMPKIASPTQQKVFKNHPSWEDNPEAQQALGPIIAKWLAQGVLEYVQWDDRQPILLQPCGAVPKGTAPFYRLITDARFGNSMYSDWGVTYASAADLSAALQPRDFTWSADLQDAYHLSVFAGCGGALRPCQRPVIGGDGSISWIDGYMVGCSPQSCLGGCDKDMSGISISGHVFRFAACQFGQKTAGSPLNSLVLSVAQYFARLSDPVHVAAWVDDLHFSMSTPDHPPCSGHAGGCPTCTQAYDRAVRAEALWREKARALNLPLSEDKGHSVAQGGAFTGVHIDTLRGTYTMLADKLKSLRETFAALVNLESASPRLLARGRGKAAHYGCAIPFLAAMGPSLTQAMHQSECPFALPAPSISEEAEDRHFDWDTPLPLSARCRAALRLMLHTITELGDLGQPIWPLLPSAAHGAFLKGQPAPDGSAVIMATVHASPHGWGLTARLRVADPAVLVHGSWALAHGLLDPSWMASPALVEVTRAPQNPDHQIALASLLGFHALAQRIPLRQYTLVMVSTSDAASRALSRGCSSDSTLQDISMLLQTACMAARLPRPLLLSVRGPTPIQPLTCAQALTAGQDTSAPALRDLVHSIAASAGFRLTIDLFASTPNTLCPRFYSLRPEASAEGHNALERACWDSTYCPWCFKRRPEFVLLFPPAYRAREALDKARQDQAQGVAILPCTPSASWWPSAMRASRSHVRRNQPFHRIRASENNLINPAADRARRLVVFHFDFWSGVEPRGLPCPHGPLLRPADPATASSSLEDTAAFDAATNPQT